MIELTDEMRRLVKARMGVPDGAYLDPWMEAAIGDVLAAVERDEVEPLRELLRQLVDEDPCWLDHHGYCQAHGLHSPPCPHRVAKGLLGGTSRPEPMAADPICGKPVGEHMICGRPPGHSFPPCGFPDPGVCDGELAS